MKKHSRFQPVVEVHIKGKNMPITSDLRFQIERKMQKLSKYLDRLATIDVELATEPTREAAARNHVEATTHVLGRTIRVASMDAEMHAAVDMTVDKLYRSLNRRKEKVKSHHGAIAAEASPAETSPLEEDEDEPIVEIERLEMKPMFEDEALEELRSGVDDFYVFLNARNEKVNVLYKRSDGTYGLIQPSPH